MGDQAGEAGMRGLRTVIVKIGGSAVTVKKQLETLKQAELDATAQQVRDATRDKATQFIIVHGAGSFGHMQARQHGVKDGWGEGPHGFAAVRRSVCELNHHVVTAFVRAGLPAVGFPAYPTWQCDDGAVAADGVAHVRAALARGLLPVLHGDAVLDRRRGCTILSGDLIIQRLAEEFRPHSVVFLTDVPGVLTAPPGEEGSELIRELLVAPDGALRAGGGGGGGVRTSHDAQVDVTGGIVNKVRAAAKIASSADGCPVYIVQNGSAHVATALAGGRPEDATLVRPEDGER